MMLKARGFELVELPVQLARSKRTKLGAVVCVITHHTVRDAGEAQKLA